FVSSQLVGTESSSAPTTPPSSSSRTYRPVHATKRATTEATHIHALKRIRLLKSCSVMSAFLTRREALECNTTHARSGPKGRYCLSPGQTPFVQNFGAPPSKFLDNTWSAAKSVRSEAGSRRAGSRRQRHCRAVRTKVIALARPSARPRALRQ